MKKITLFGFIFFGLSASLIQAQSLLSLEEAISIGLEENYSVRISENRLEVAANNRSLGNAGILPSVTASGTRTESIEDSEFATTQGTQTATGARSTSTNASVNLNWTLFDGFRMFRSYDLLGVLEEIGDAELRFEMENLIRTITVFYYDIARIENQLRFLENTVDVSLERIQIEETKLDLGSGSEVELLQARSDLNADRSALLSEQNQLDEAKVNLNQLLSRDPETEFTVDETIPLQRGLDEEFLYNQTLSENSELDISRMQKNAADIELNQIRGERYPEIELSSGYRYSRNEAGGGFFQFNQTTGLSIGLTARVNLFDGFNTSRRIQNAKITQKNQQLQLEESRLRVESRFRTLYRRYLNSMELVDLEEENLSNAEETLDIALERFRLGTISPLELREAQRTFLESENRLIDARFDAKFAETELLQLSGRFESSLMSPE